MTSGANLLPNQDHADRAGELERKAAELVGEARAARARHDGTKYRTEMLAEAAVFASLAQSHRLAELRDEMRAP